MTRGSDWHSASVHDSRKAQLPSNYVPAIKTARHYLSVRTTQPLAAAFSRGPLAAFDTWPQTTDSSAQEIMANRMTGPNRRRCSNKQSNPPLPANKTSLPPRYFHQQFGGVRIWSVTRDNTDARTTLPKATDSRLPTSQQDRGTQVTKRKRTGAPVSKTGQNQPCPSRGSRNNPPALDLALPGPWPITNLGAREPSSQISATHQQRHWTRDSSTGSLTTEAKPLRLRHASGSIPLSLDSSFQRMRFQLRAKPVSQLCCVAAALRVAEKWGCLDDPE